MPDIVEYKLKEERENRINNSSRNSNSLPQDNEETYIQREVEKINEIFKLKREILIPSMNRAKEVEKTTITEVDISQHKRRKVNIPALYFRSDYTLTRSIFNSDYEATVEDFVFCKRIGISVEDLEKIVTHLENLVNSNEMINQEIASEVMVNNFNNIDHKHYGEIFKVSHYILKYLTAVLESPPRREQEVTFAPVLEDTEVHRQEVGRDVQKE